MTETGGTAAIAERLRIAFTTHDPTTLEPLLAPDVQWGSCVGSTQVVEWMEGALADGLETSLEEVVAEPDRVVIALRVHRANRHDEPSDHVIYQVAFVDGDKITELGAAADRDDARSRPPSDAPSPPVGPPTGIDRMATVLPVADLALALEHYRRLGFTVREYAGGGYGYAERGGAGFHFTELAGLDPRRSTSAVYLYVDDADALYAEWRSAGVTGQFFEPEDTEYGLREGAHVDRNGNLLRFGSPLSKD